MPNTRCYCALVIALLILNLCSGFSVLRSFTHHQQLSLLPIIDSPRVSICRPIVGTHQRQRWIAPLFLSSDSNENSQDDDELDLLEKAFGDGATPEVIVRGSDADNIDGSVWEDLETGEPPRWMIMKELLGINIFTYTLAALIAFFFSMNFFIGPGWLGSVMGFEGTGSINEVSDSLPGTVDLSSPEFRL